MRNPDLDGPNHASSLAANVCYGIVAFVLLAVMVMKMAVAA